MGYYSFTLAISMCGFRSQVLKTNAAINSLLSSVFVDCVESVQTANPVTVAIIMANTDRVVCVCLCV